MFKFYNSWIDRPWHVYMLLFAISGNYYQISICNFDFIYCGSYRPGDTHVFVAFGWCWGIVPGRLSVRLLGVLINIDLWKENEDTQS